MASVSTAVSVSTALVVERRAAACSAAATLSVLSTALDLRRHSFLRSVAVSDPSSASAASASCSPRGSGRPAQLLLLFLPFFF